MNLRPIVARELRQQARRPMTYWVRPMAMAAALLAIALLDPNAVLEPNQGGRAFTLLHQTLFFTIWICAPLLTADCLSHERREDTLGLLFLTPLKAWEVVAAKGAAQGLRAATLVLAVVPALAVPILLGGVSWRHVAISAVILALSLGLALSAGLVASSLCRARNRALILAALLAGAALAAAILLTGALLCFAADALRYSGVELNLEAFREVGWMTLQNEHECWKDVSRVLPPGAWWMIGSVIAGVCALLVGLVIVLSAIRLRSSLREKPASKFRLWLEALFFTPAYAVGFYYRWLKRGLQKNPIGWLEKRRWSGRLATWVWASIASVFLIGALSHADVVSDKDGVAVIKFIFWVIAVNMALMAAGSFARERATGVMELLLISPLREWQIIFGRLRGIWSQFLPGVALLAAALLLAAILQVQRHSGQVSLGQVWLGMVSPLCFAVMLATVPMIGLYYSLRCRSYLSSLLMTLLMSMVIPWGACGLGLWGLETLADNFSPSLFFTLKEDPVFLVFRVALLSGGLPILWQAVIGIWLLRRLHRRLVWRDFSYQTG
jgi:ABC-type transport system involved in multi-copper enzyme maturation permease subunit